MEKRNLGRSALKTAPLVFGGNVFGWTIDEKTSFKLLDQFADAGFNMIDTADIYSRWANGNSGGESETILGNWLKKRGKRHDMLIATKAGGEMDYGKGLTKKHIQRAVEESLNRLQIETIDLYQSHFDDLNTPVQDTLEAYAHLIKEGKVKAIGASNFSAKRLEQAMKASEREGLPRYDALQPLYNLYDRKEFEEGTREVCKKYDIGVISYYSLASGFLTGKYRSKDDLGKSKRGSKVEKYMSERGNRILTALDEVADQHDTSQASVSLAWVMAQPGLTAPIASATTSAQLAELIDAVHLKLSEKDILKLNEASNY